MDAEVQRFECSLEPHQSWQGQRSKLAGYLYADGTYHLVSPLPMQGPERAQIAMTGQLEE
ncbi:MAG: hypothetical protein AB7P03_19055 [Kofleriaceae bacterium]